MSTLRDALDLPPDQRGPRCAACLTGERLTIVPPAIKVCRLCLAEALSRIGNPRRPGGQQAPRCSGCGTFSIAAAERHGSPSTPRVYACAACLARTLADMNREQAAADPDRSALFDAARAAELETVVDQYDRLRSAGNRV